MNVTRRDWNALNATIRRLTHPEDGLGPDVITRASIEKYRIGILSHNFTIWTSVAIELRRNGTLINRICANYRSRSRDSFQICKVVGSTIRSCNCQDSGVYLYIEGGDVVVFPFLRPSGNCQIDFGEGGRVSL